MIVEKIREWSHKVLPSIYDDSLSYYEVLNKVCAKCNEVIDAVNDNTEDVQEAVSAANQAISSANTATTTANAAASDASTAVTTANSAVSTANTANTNASNAVTTANAAASDASTAVTTANSAVSTANTANTNASNAVTTANSALRNSVDYRSYWIPILVAAQGGTAVNGSSSVVEEYVNAITDYTHKTLLAQVYLYNEDDFTAPISIVSQAPNDIVFKVEGITARTSSRALFFSGQLHYTRTDADSPWERVVADCTSVKYAVALSTY